MADNFATLAVVKSSMADIKLGTFIGTATVTQPDTTLRSVEVVVFPDNLRGTAEGHYPWDLGPSSMMTNAMVANAVKGVDGQTVTVTYKGGEKKIDIPVNVPVVAVVPASKDDIAPGGIVFVPSVELRVVQLQPDVLQLYHPQKTAGCARSLGVLVLSNQPVEVG